MPLNYKRKLNQSIIVENKTTEEYIEITIVGINSGNVELEIYDPKQPNHRFNVWRTETLS